MGVKRIVNTDFWSDGMVIDCFSPEDKYFMLYLLTNPHTKQLGIYKLSKKQASFETGYSLDTIETLIVRFQNNYKIIIYSENTYEIALLNYLKHSILNGGKPVYDCIRKDLNDVRDKGLINDVYVHLEEYFNESSSVAMKEIGCILKEKVDSFKTIHTHTHIHTHIQYGGRLVDDSSKPNPKKRSTDSIFKKMIEDFSLDDSVRSAIYDFLDHRNSIKKAVKTKRTLELIFKELEKHSNEDKVRIIEQSIMNGWQGLFELRKSNSGNKPEQSNVFTEIGRDMGIW